MIMRNYVLYIAAIGAGLASAQEPGQKTFNSAREACDALAQAVRSDNEQALEAILGRGTLSPDKEEARLERHHFAEKYDQMHRMVQEPEGAMVLYVGAENWPFPVPLVSNRGKWFFDAEAGKEEIRYRRVGENEITAMEVSDRFSALKKQGSTKASAGDAISQIAQKLAAEPPGGRESFHGYAFRVVGSGNLALVAYPTEYRVSGITTFLVANDGAVYEKDLGNDTQRTAEQLKERPTSGWSAVK
jgi:Protein of unknown function (DUF2950)